MDKVKLPYPKETEENLEAYKDFKVGSYVRIKKDNPEGCYFHSKKLTRENAIFKIIKAPSYSWLHDWCNMLVQIKDGNRNQDHWMYCPGMELCDPPVKPKKTIVDFKDLNLPEESIRRELEVLNLVPQYTGSEAGFSFSEIKKIINKYLEVTSK